MLHLNTIDEKTHNVLLSLLNKDYLSSFSLVRGTALSLLYGHRKSIDLDLFSPAEFEPGIIDAQIQIDYPIYNYRGNNKSMLFLDINNVKTDLVFHNFELLFPVHTKENIRMFSIPDIAAMKCYAICRRGTRKDMYDMWALAQHYKPTEIVDFFVKKYGEEKLIFLKKVFSISKKQTIPINLKFW